MELNIKKKYLTPKSEPGRITGNLVDVYVICVIAIRLKVGEYPFASIKQTEISPITKGFRSPWIDGLIKVYFLT